MILCAFAGAVGTLTTERIHSDFNRQVRNAADRLQDRLLVLTSISNAVYVARPGLDTYVGGSSAAIKIVNIDGFVYKQSSNAPPWLGVPTEGPSVEINGYLVENRKVVVYRGFDKQPVGVAYMQYARPLSDVEPTVNRVRFFLLVGVLSGAGLALLAGLWIATRAMAPIAELTAAAREIERTRDPARRVPEIEADDEVAELSRTLDGMLRALDASRNDTEAALHRQREFVADASHELRTPLTSVLANLELLADSLDGERGEAAQSALRSSRRMRRLVADLLLLARADAERQAPRAPTDLGDVLMEAAGELSPVADGHELHVDASPAIVDGARDELHRLALNLMENAIRHTPEGTSIHAGVERRNGSVVLTVEDDGPGIRPELRERVFERFVRGSGDSGRSFGLGLSIVRAVAESHGGSVRVESPTKRESSIAHGTRFVVTLPAAGVPQADPVTERPGRP